MRTLSADLQAPRQPMGYICAPGRKGCARWLNLDRLQAMAISVELWEMGVLSYCPQLNGPACGSTDLDLEQWLAMENEVLKRCDWILLAPGWEQDQTCMRQFNLAMNLNIQVLFEPGQAKAYADSLMEAWQQS